MTLRVGLTIGGDSSQAQAALRAASVAVEELNRLEAAGIGVARAGSKAALDLSDAQQRVAATTAGLRAQFNPTFAVLRNYKTTLETIHAAHRIGAITAVEMADALGRERVAAQASLAAIKGHSSALSQLGSGTNAGRIGLQQLGFQAQDVAVQMSLGTDAVRALSMQLPQAIGAMQLMANSTGSAGGAFNRFATFLAGPWGVALGVAIPVAGLLAQKLFDTADAAAAAEQGTSSFAAAQAAVTGALERTSGALASQNALLLANARLQAITLRGDALANRREADGIYRRAGQASIGRQIGTALLGAFGAAGGAHAPGRTGLPQARPATASGSVQRLIQDVRSGRLSAADALRLSETQNFDGLRISRAELQDAIISIAEAREQDDVARLIDESLNAGTAAPQFRRGGGRGERPAGGRSGRSAAGRAERLNAGDLRFAQSVEDSIQRINERWTAQPSLIRQARGAVDDLNDIIGAAQARLARGGIGEREAAALRGQIADAQGAIQTVAEGLNEPFARLQQQSEQQVSVLQLIRAGRDDEAAALQQIFQLQDQVGDVTREQREAILANVVAERELNEAIARRSEMIGAYQQSISDVRADLEALLSGQGDGNFLGNLRRNFQQLQGRVLTEQIFGPALRGLEQYVREETGISSAVDIMTTGTERAGRAASSLADVFDRARGLIERPAAGPLAGVAAGAGLGAGGPTGDPLGAIAVSVAAVAEASDAAAGAIAEAAASAENRDIVVTGGVMALRPDAFFNRLVKDTVDPALAALDDLLGTRFFSGLSGVLSGALQGYVTAGPTGAVLGALGGIRGLPDGIQKGLARGLAGAQTGTQIAALGKGLGLKTSSTGGAIGGAIGGATGIPGADIVGSIIGSLVGGLVKKTPYGTAVVSGAGDASVTGNKKAARAAAGSLAEAVQNGLSGIAEQLGGEVGSYLVSIGTYKDKVRVSGSGKTGKLKGGDVVDFGKDGQEAGVAYAIQNAIADGGIQGLSAAVQRALGSTSNLDKAVKEALKVQEVETALGGIGAIMAREFRTFEAQARERVRVARDYGFDLIAIEKYNAEQRQALTQKLLDAQVGSLQRLVEEMTSGSLFEGSAFDRRDALLAQIDVARGELSAGKEGAGDRLAGLFEQLNSLSKEIYGTTGGFAADRASILDQATAAIAQANERIAAASAASDPALTTTNAALDENNDQNAVIIAQLGSMNAQLAELTAANSLLGNRLSLDRLSGLAVTSQ